MGSVHLRQSRRRTDLRHRVRRKYLAAGALPGCASEKGIEQGTASKTRGPAAKQEGVGGGHRLQGSLIFDHIARLKGTGGTLGGLSNLLHELLNEGKVKEAGELNASITHTIRQIEFLLNNLLHWSIRQQDIYQPHIERFDLLALTQNIIEIGRAHV